jgi:hypothetical protein
MSALPATEVRIPFRWCCCSRQSYCLVRRCKVPKRAAALARLRCRKDARRSAHRSPIRGQATSWLGPGDVDAGDDHQVIASGGQWCGLGFCTRRGDAPTHSQCLRFRMRRHHAHGFPPLLSRIPVALLPLISPFVPIERQQLSWHQAGQRPSIAICPAPSASDTGSHGNASL